MKLSSLPADERARWLERLARDCAGADGLLAAHGEICMAMGGGGNYRERLSLRLADMLDYIAELEAFVRDVAAVPCVGSQFGTGCNGCPQYRAKALIGKREENRSEQ